MLFKNYNVLLHIVTKNGLLSPPRKVAQKNGRGSRSPVDLLFLVLHPPEEMPSPEDRLT